MIGSLFCLFRWAAFKNIFYASALILLFASLTFFYHFAPAIRLFEYAPFFAIGLLAWLAICYPVIPMLYIPVLISIVFVGFYGGLSLSNLIFGSLAFFLILFWQPKKYKWRFFGTISYSLYVIHPPFVTLQHIIGLRLIDTAFKPILFLLPVASMAVCIFAAWALYKLVEEPTVKISKRIKYI